MRIIFGKCEGICANNSTVVIVAVDFSGAEGLASKTGIRAICFTAQWLRQSSKAGTG